MTQNARFLSFVACPQNGQYSSSEVTKGDEVCASRTHRSFSGVGEVQSILWTQGVPKTLAGNFTTHEQSTTRKENPMTSNQHIKFGIKFAIDAVKIDGERD